MSKQRLAIQLGGTALVAKPADPFSEEGLAAGTGGATMVWLGRERYMPHASKGA